jgi:large subunit ribosomal protein L6
MSRIGNTPVVVPEGVTVDIQPSALTVKGPKGEIQSNVPRGITVAQKDQEIVVSRSRNDRKLRALHGLVRARLANDVTGVSKGWTKTLELRGVGYRANISGKSLVLSLGFSHPVTIDPPPGIAFEVKDGNVVVSGIDKQKVGQVAARVRFARPPEPYKGKGIRYSGEYVRKKAGKAAKAVGTG